MSKEELIYMYEQFSDIGTAYNEMMWMCSDERMCYYHITEDEDEYMKILDIACDLEQIIALNWRAVETSIDDLLLRTAYPVYQVLHEEEMYDLPF